MGTGHLAVHAGTASPGCTFPCQGQNHKELRTGVLHYGKNTAEELAQPSHLNLEQSATVHPQHGQRGKCRFSQQWPPHRPHHRDAAATGWCSVDQGRPAPGAQHLKTPAWDTGMTLLSVT